MAAMGIGIGGTAASMVFLLFKVEMRRIPLLILVYDDLFDEDELMEDGAEVMEEDVKEDVLLWPRCSLELHEVGCVESDVRDGGGRKSDGVDSKSSAETFLVTESSVVVGFCGTLMPRSSAVRKNCRSTSSSVVSWLKRRTIIL